jgi:hypothetical protein
MTAMEGIVSPTHKLYTEIGESNYGETEMQQFKLAEHFQ